MKKDEKYWTFLEYKTSKRHEQKTHSMPIKVSGITASPADVDLEARILM